MRGPEFHLANPVGKDSALYALMAGWKSVEEIVAFQVSRELRREVLKATRTGPVAKDYDFRRQIRKSARSAPSNLSEGFRRYHHGEFAYHTNVALASLAETLNHIEDGFDEDYFSKDVADKMTRLATRAIKACTGLMRHLRTSKAPLPYWSESPERQPRKTPGSPTKTPHPPSST